MLWWIKSWWYHRLRKIDLQILWRSCIEKALDLDHAKAAFAMHCYNDPAWLFLGESSIYEIIDSLTEESYA